MICYIILSAILSLVGVFTPLLLGIFIDNILVHRNIHLLVKFIAIVSLLGIGFLIINSISILINNKLIINTNYYLGKAIRDRIQKVNIKELLHKDNGNLIQIITRDLANCQFIFNHIISIALEIISFFLIFYILFNIDPLLPIAFSLILPIYYLSYEYFSKKISYTYNNIITITDRLSKTIGDIQNNLLIYKQNPYNNVYDKDYYNHINETYVWQRKRGFLDASFSFFNQFSFLIIVLGVLFYGGYLVIKGSLSVGFLTALLAYSARFYIPITKISKLFVSCKLAMISIKRVYNYYKLNNDIEGDKKIEIINGEIDIQNYPFNKDFSLNTKIKRGRINFIFGANGIGKSTLINSLIRILPINKNTFYIDNIDLINAKHEEIRNKISVIFQKGQFIGHTIQEQIYYSDLKGKKSNINTFAKEIVRNYTDEKLKKFNTSININSLSGGQKQYISILTALRSFPEILILDETLSHLDHETSARIFSLLREISDYITIIIITHNKEYIDVKNDTIINLNTIMSREELYKNLNIGS